MNAFELDAFQSGAFQEEVAAGSFAFQECVFQEDAFQADLCSPVVPEVEVFPGSGWPYLPTGKKTKGKRFDDELAKAMRDIYEGIEEPEILKQAAKIVRPMVQKGIQKTAVPLPESIDWEKLEKDAEKVSALLKLWQEQLQFREEEEMLVLMSIM